MVDETRPATYRRPFLVDLATPQLAWACGLFQLTDRRACAP